MPLPIIANVYRATLLWSKYAGVAPRNVLYFKDNTGTSDEGAVATAIRVGMAVHMWLPMHSSYSLTQINVIKLDGTSAGLTSTVTSVSGEQTTDPIPQSAALVKFFTGLRGPANRGRLYMGPLSESAQAGGVLDATMAGTLATAWATGWSNWSSNSPSLSLGVVSRKHGTFHALNIAPQIEPLCGTQRRRQKQVRRG